MATAPVKSPLHNFPLTFLKWGSKKDTRCRRTPPFDTPLSPPPLDAVEHSSSNPVGSRSSRNRRNNHHHHHHHHPETPPLDDDDNEEERETGKKLPEVLAEDGGCVGGGDEKGWNLRPRRAVTMKGTCSNSTMVETSANGGGGDGLPKSMRLRGLDTVVNGGISGGNNGGGGGGGEKRKFWIALSRDEIEEDIYSMTGSKPSRRPKKRHKNVQKQLDIVFPGLWLVGISPDAYRGLHVPPKPKR